MMRLSEPSFIGDFFRFRAVSGKDGKREYIGEWLQARFRIPNAEYGKLTEVFNSVNFNAEESMLGEIAVKEPGEYKISLRTLALLDPKAEQMNFQSLKFQKQPPNNRRKSKRKNWL